MSIEVFDQLDNYSKYYISNKGRVLSLWHKNAIFLKPYKNANGYHEFDLYNDDNEKKRWFAHRLVATTYLCNSQKYPYINHVDSNPLNNDVENLEWCTPSHNNYHAYRTGRKTGVRGSKNHLSILKEHQVIEIVEGASDGFNGAEMARFYGVNKDTAYNILNGRRWRWLTGIAKRPASY